MRVLKNIFFSFLDEINFLQFEENILIRKIFKLTKHEKIKIYFSSYQTHSKRLIETLGSTTDRWSGLDPYPHPYFFPLTLRSFV